MSTRYLKKIYGSDIAVEKNEDESEQEASDVEVRTGKQKNFNVFNLLNDNSENDVESNEEPEVKNEEEEEVCDSKSKSKKKRKRHKKAQKQREEREEHENDETEDGEVLDEIDRTVRQINRLLGEPVASTSSGSADNLQGRLVAKSKERMLAVQHKHLNPYNELKRIFGSRTIQAEQNKPRTRGRTGHLKKTWMVNIHDNLVPANKSGITMALDKSVSGDGVQYFVFEHGPSYRQVQQKFINAVESLNPENIISIVNAHPYHVDSLLQAAELCKLSEELAMAASLIERALFYMEYAFHPLFNMTTATCRMDYRKQQNRALFITLFKHLILVGGRACYRTSLELSKFLLSLDPEGDPLAAVLMIDFYAIRSKEYEWFCEFCDLWENSRNLQQLPNIAYSLALAHFYLGKRESADELLQNALIMFPGVLIPLLDKCSISPDTKLMGHDYFLLKATASTSPALEKLQSLYITRSFHLWKEADILPWLEKNVNQVLQRVDMKDEYVKYCEVKRSRRYQGKLPRNILRHLILSDLKDVPVGSQEIQNEGPILSHDPLPPVNSIDIYSKPRAARRNNQTNSNLLSLFFSSIFMDLEAEVAGAGAGAGAAAANRQNENRENQENRGFQEEYD